MKRDIGDEAIGGALGLAPMDGLSDGANCARARACRGRPALTAAKADARGAAACAASARLPCACGPLG